MKIPKWTDKDNWHAIEQGWSCFDSDSEFVAIQRIDDPPSCRPSACTCDPGDKSGRQCCNVCLAHGFTQAPSLEPRFDGDDSALIFVLQHAAKDKTCRKAIKLTYGF